MKTQDLNKKIITKKPKSARNCESWAKDQRLKTSRIWQGTSDPSRPYYSLEEKRPPVFTFLAWCILFVLCWPLAMLALLAYPFIWLLLLPFRILGVAVHGVLEMVYLAITLPFRLLAAPFRI